MKQNRFRRKGEREKKTAKSTSRTLKMPESQPNKNTIKTFYCDYLFFAHFRFGSCSTFQMTHSTKFNSMHVFIWPRSQSHFRNEWNHYAFRTSHVYDRWIFLFVVVVDTFLSLTSVSVQREVLFFSASFICVSKEAICMEKKPTHPLTNRPFSNSLVADRKFRNGSFDERNAFECLFKWKHKTHIPNHIMFFCINWTWAFFLFHDWNRFIFSRTKRISFSFNLEYLDFEYWNWELGMFARQIHWFGWSIAEFRLNFHFKYS